MRAYLVVVALWTVAGCKDGGPPAPVPSAAPWLPPVIESATSARRPFLRYFLGRTEARCEIYRVDDANISSATPTPCPPDLQNGERIRIAGKTCLRESGDPLRVVPVVCPISLMAREQGDRSERTP